MVALSAVMPLISKIAPLLEIFTALLAIDPSAVRAELTRRRSWLLEYTFTALNVVVPEPDLVTPALPRPMASHTWMSPVPANERPKLTLVMALPEATSM